MITNMTEDTINMILDEYVVLKTWEEIDKDYSHFINEDNFDCPEIYIKEDNYYMSDEYKNILGQKVKVSILSRATGAKDKWWTDRCGGYTISEFMIKREACPELDPECFV